MSIKDKAPDDFTAATLSQVGALQHHIPALDGLRGLAIVWVVWHNVTAGNYEGGAFARLLNLLSNTGWAGVQLFFVLSGFLITGILIDGKGSAGQVKTFFIRRVLRIFPLYYAVLLIAFVVIPLVGLAPEWLDPDRRDQFWYWAYLINWSAPFLEEHGRIFGHFWSLAVEEQFYLLWPACVVLLSSKSLARLCVALMIVSLVFRAIMTTYWPEFSTKAAYSFTVARWDALAIGALVAIALRNGSFLQALMGMQRNLSLILYAYVVVFVLWFRNFGPVVPGVGVLNQSVLACIFALWLVVLVCPADRRSSISPRTFFESHTMRLFGKYSYAIYVFHQPLNILSAALWAGQLSVIKTFGPIISETIRAGFVFILALLLALISWRVLEQPFQNLKRRFPAMKKPMPV